MVTRDEVLAYARDFPRSTEVVVYGRWKLRVGQIVYVAFSKDESLMGFAYPKEEREALVETSPERFMLPSGADLRFQWVVARLAAIDPDEMGELVLDAWRMVVPKRVAAAYLSRHPE